MSEDEFWRSTAAKVQALYEVQVLDWNRTRDFFPSLIAAFYLNAHSNPDARGKVYEAEDILASRYIDLKKKRESVIITHDPDRGAQGDWRSLKAGLKGMTKEAEKKRKGLRPFTSRRKR